MTPSPTGPSENGRRAHWTDWARFLHRWGFDEVATFLLTGLGPVNPLIAQLLHAGRTPGNPNSSWQALADLLEDPEETRAFAAFLRQEKDH